MVRLLFISMFALCLVMGTAFAQTIEWDQVSSSATEQESGVVADAYGSPPSATVNDLWVRANAMVRSGDNPSVSSSAKYVITASQTGRITSLGNYNSVRIYGRLRHYASAQITFVYGSLTQKYESYGKVAVTSHNGAYLEYTKVRDAAWGSQYTPVNNDYLLADVPNWDGEPIQLLRISKAVAECSRSGLNLLVETVETTASIRAEGYNR